MNWIDIVGQKEYLDITDFPQNCYGFIYKITHIESGKIYIGKKQLSFDRKKKLGKKELALREVKPGRIPTSKRVITESDWKDYWGSSIELKEEIQKQGKDKFERVIIQFAYSSKQLTYYETMYQFKYNVLQTDSFNNSILGKFHRKDFI
jgi:hypothetical protein